MRDTQHAGDEPLARGEAMIFTEDEALALTTGDGFWRTARIERTSREVVPSIVLSDGPHGIRRSVVEDGLGFTESLPATCFPTAAALAATWHRGLIERVGAALGAEAAAAGVQVLLGPGMNIKRSPLGGRNFEYFSEDPHLTAELAGALVRGIQSRGVAACVKHFAVNNQESDRMRVSADVDEVALREVYLSAFERVVRKESPWAMMSAYNSINGVRASENKALLTTILRNEWGFDGVVISDWGAVRDSASALAAGLDLEMPQRSPEAEEAVRTALRTTRRAPSRLQESAGRVAELVARTRQGAIIVGDVDDDDHHRLAQEAAAAAVVVLKNDAVADHPVLPLQADGSIALIGEFARTPRYQGSGSSRVRTKRVDTLLESLSVGHPHVRFSPGFVPVITSDPDDDRLRAEAVHEAARADAVVLALGLPPDAESEGFDRTTLSLPENQRRLVEAVAAVNRRVVVVLFAGGVVTVDSWGASVPAIVHAWLGGQGGGTGVADVLIGDAEPRGRMPETVPHRVQDLPAYGNFPGAEGHVRYAEGVHVGYRWFDVRDIDVAYPFGHGLSYTRFAYGELRADRDEAGGTWLGVEVTNVGARRGVEVVQLYVDMQTPGTGSGTQRRLVGFESVSLDPGATATVEFHVDDADLARWSSTHHCWVVQPGRYAFAAGSSSRALHSRVHAEVMGSPLTQQIHHWSTVSEALRDPHIGPPLGEMLQGKVAPEEAGLLDDLPLAVLATFGLGGFSEQKLTALLDDAHPGGDGW